MIPKIKPVVAIPLGYVFLCLTAKIIDKIEGTSPNIKRSNPKIPNTKLAIPNPLFFCLVICICTKYVL